MEDLIKALQIFLKYENVTYPFQCAYDELYVHGDKYNLDDISQEDIDELGKLGFLWNKSLECFYSFRYGSC